MRDRRRHPQPLGGRGQVLVTQGVFADAQVGVGGMRSPDRGGHRGGPAVPKHVHKEPQTMLEVSDLVQPPHVLVDLLERFSLLFCRATPKM